MIKCSGAGIVVYYDNRDSSIKGLENDILYLSLTDNEGFYDFPKGGIDEGEYSFQCALRETYEEINLRISDFKSFYGTESDEGFSCGRGLIMFIGEIKKESIGNTKIKMNLKTEHFEHKSCEWLTKDKLISETIVIDDKKEFKLPLYLQKCLNWASKKIV